MKTLKNKTHKLIKFKHKANKQVHGQVIVSLVIIKINQQKKNKHQYEERHIFYTN
jgi:hypothetical protein